MHAIFIPATMTHLAAHPISTGVAHVKLPWSLRKIILFISLIHSFVVNIDMKHKDFHTWSFVPGLLNSFIPIDSLKLLP